MLTTRLRIPKMKSMSPDAIAPSFPPTKSKEVSSNVHLRRREMTVSLYAIHWAGVILVFCAHTKRKLGLEHLFLLCTRG